MAKKTTKEKIVTPQDVENMQFPDGICTNTIIDYDLRFIHYLKTGKTYTLYVAPYEEIITTFWHDYKDLLTKEPVLDPDLKVFVVNVSELPEDDKLFFIPFKNKPASKKVLEQLTKNRISQKKVDDAFKKLKIEHSQLLRNQALILAEHGVIDKGKIGRVYHKKLIASDGELNWVCQIQQNLPSVGEDKRSSISLELPDLERVRELMAEFPQHKKILSQLLTKNTEPHRTYDIEVEADSLIALAKLLARFDLKRINLSFDADEHFDESKFDEYELNPWTDEDYDEQTVLEEDELEAKVNKLPFDLKLQLYKNLPKVEDARMPIHYKTYQKTDPECHYCGSKFVPHTRRCSSCGCVSLEVEGGKTKKKAVNLKKKADKAPVVKKVTTIKKATKKATANKAAAKKAPKKAAANKKAATKKKAVKTSTRRSKK